MSEVTTVEDLRASLARRPVEELRRIVRLGKLHAKLTNLKRKAHGLTAAQAKVLAKLESTRLGI